MLKKYYEKLTIRKMGTVFVILATINVLITFVSCKTCIPIDSCTCKLDSGEEISLRSLNDNHEPKFQLTDVAIGSTRRYYYNPCTAFNQGNGCTDTLVCQADTSTRDTYPLGKVHLTTQYIGSSLQFQYDGGVFNFVQRKTNINLQCDENADTPKVSVMSYTGFNPVIYSFTLSSKCACPGGCSISEGGLSTGTVLCILLFVFVTVYLVGGTLYLKYYKKQEGKDMIPNADFWKDIPSKVKDGALFTKEMVDRKIEGYQEL